MVTDICQKQTEVLEIEKHQILIIRDTEYHRHNRALYIGKTQHTSEKDRAELGDVGTHRDAHLTEYIVECGRICLIFEVLDTELRDSFFHAVIADTCCADTGHIALYIC